MKLRELLQQMKKVQEDIGTSEPFICGGTPRDRYMKRLDNVSDLDITTGDKTVQYLAQEFGAALAKQYNVTRRNHDDGHSSVYIGSFKMDFSSNYNAPNIDVLLGQKGIQKPTDMQREMFSRDFTCNALLLSLDLKNLHDPTKLAFKDIKDKVIRTCLAPEITLTSNKNRVIRAIYLASKLDFDIDQSIIDFVKANPQSVKIASEKVMTEKLNEAFNRDADKAAYYVGKMGIWEEIPITEVVRPYYMKQSNNKIAYFQGGGGVNEPTPGKKKYKSDPAIVVQPRFEEPFYRNYDVYNVPGKYGPGAGWHDMQKYKSVSEFLEAKRQKLKGKYEADDSWIQDSGKITKENPNKIKTRASLFAKIIKVASDENDGPNFDYGKGLYSNMDKYKSVKDFEEHADKGPGAFFADDNALDFPSDAYDDPGITSGTGGLMEILNPAGGLLEPTMTEKDLDHKGPETLDFGRDYDSKEQPADLGSKVDISHIEKLLDKYLSHGTYGLPDGVDMPDEDLNDKSDLNPEYGTVGPDSLMYEDKWNI